MNDPIVTTPPTPADPSAAPSSAAPSPADTQAQIDALMRTPEYQRSDRATVDLVQQWHQFKEHGRVLEPELSDRAADLATPPEYIVPEIVRDDAAKTIQALGLGPVGQPVYEFFLGRSGPPSIPPAYQPLAPEVAAQKLRESEGQFFDRTLDLARDAVSALDHLRSRSGRPAGELLRFLETSGAGNDPAVVKFFARLAGRFQTTEPQLMGELARRRSAR